ncbi:GNAT family N-acetyltransferase [Lacinutrix sp. C3R15]|uniref:GNAT family N-acetyltransferase n=1 Tax=Flavobacteriaceae TaxID=49546 RepID=UPI001C0807C0|nr:MULTISPECIES: GNAT family N-acetyltransferase [Flavobacteriaceae]MBU2938008.1 GNAT family N-acetyltransferase [Lacinutrix sp. C3R15]MDO6621322.1 GNAT family N-acetyltransferase [Oceanihabitans sp. 1_MG-2023]
MLNIVTKTFNELTIQELYSILQLRSEVFVVEQDCVYQDIDGKDQKALHVIGFKADKIVAYTRIFKPGLYFKEASIGRVVVAENQRKHKYGFAIMKASIAAIKEYYGEETIKISAQCYLKKFYNSLGFKEIGEEYLEDGIPHIGMLKN